MPFIGIFVPRQPQLLRDRLVSQGKTVHLVMRKLLLLLRRLLLPQGRHRVAWGRQPLSLPTSRLKEYRAIMVRLPASSRKGPYMAL